MNLPKDSFQMDAQDKVLRGWRAFISSINESMDSLERGIDEADEMTDICTPEWCIANDRIMDEMNNRIFSISEPFWSSEKDSKRLKELKKRLRDIYARYKAVLKQGEGMAV